MIFAILIFGAMAAVHLFYSGELHPSMRVAYWLAYTLSGFVIGYVFHQFFIAAVVQGVVVLAYLARGYTASSRAGGV